MGTEAFYSSPSVPCRPIPEGALPSVKEMDHNETTIEDIQGRALAALDAATSLAALEELRVKLLGKKGSLPPS